MGPLSRLNLNAVMLIVVGLWITTHILFLYNKHYTIVSEKGTVLLKDVNENVYDLFVYNKDAGEQMYYIKHTSIKIFGQFPESTLSYLIWGYYLIGGIWVYLIMEDEKRSKNKLSKAQATEKTLNLMADLKQKFNLKK